MTTANQISTINSLTHTQRNPYNSMKSHKRKEQEEGEKKNLKKKPTTINKMAIRTIYIDNYPKCKWIKYSNQNKYIGLMY